MLTSNWDPNKKLPLTYKAEPNKKLPLIYNYFFPNRCDYNSITFVFIRNVPFSFYEFPSVLLGGCVTKHNNFFSLTRHFPFWGRAFHFRDACVKTFLLWYPPCTRRISDEYHSKFFKNNCHSFYFTQVKPSSGGITLHFPTFFTCNPSILMLCEPTVILPNSTMIKTFKLFNI